MLLIGKSTTVLFAWVGLSAAAPAPDYLALARALDASIQESYAYPEKLPGGILPQSQKLGEKRETVRDANSLLRYAEDRMLSLTDHHAITGSSFKDSWAVILTYTDLWIINRNGRFIVDAVREGSPAARAGIEPGNLLVAVDRVDTAAAVRAFWSDLGLAVTPSRAEFSARVLVAGRRDRDRNLGIADTTGKVRQLTLPSLYSVARERRLPVTISSVGKRNIVRFNNSLGDDAAIAAFDEAMQGIPLDHQVVLDLRDTPSGGNTTIARAVMGWFVNKPHGYQVHNRPAEERATGIARQWIEQVLPRRGKFRKRLPTIWVGRWTGSMGEGLAIGFASMGAAVRGGPMAGLNGSVEDIRIGDTNMSVKLPTERLMTISYQPREGFQPRPMR